MSTNNQTFNTAVPVEAAPVEVPVIEPAPIIDDGGIDGLMARLDAEQGVDRTPALTPEAQPVVEPQAINPLVVPEVPASIPQAQVPLQQPVQEPVASVAQNPEVAALLANLKSQQDSLAQQQATFNQQVQQQQAAQAPNPDQALWDMYQMNVPANISDMMNGDNVADRNAAYAALIQQGLATVHKNLRDELQQKVQEVPQYGQERMNYDQSIQAARDDLYKAHPGLNNPALGPLIQDAASRLVPQYGGNWNPQVRDAIAADVQLKVSQFTQVPVQQPVGPVMQPQVQAQQVQRQPFVAGNSPTYPLQPPVEDPNSPESIAALFS